jgi:hypothetical protein
MRMGSVGFVVIGPEIIVLFHVDILDCVGLVQGGSSVVRSVRLLWRIFRSCARFETS